MDFNLQEAKSESFSVVKKALERVKNEPNVNFSEHLYREIDLNVKFLAVLVEMERNEILKQGLLANESDTKPIPVENFFEWYQKNVRGEG